MKKKIITTIIAVASLTMTSCGHDTDIDKSEQNTAVQESSTTASVDESSTETTKQNVQVTESEQITAVQEIDTTTSSNEFIMEATSSVAVAIRVDASQYFVDEREICNKVIHSIVQEDDGFGSYLIEKHPTLKGIEYIVEFDNDYSPCNSFCYQSQEPFVSIGCSGETRKLSDWGFETWDDVLKHYDLESLES